MTSTASAPIWAQFLDPYDRRARLLPALLCLLPPLTIFVLVYPASLSWRETILVLLASCGAFFMVSRVARNAGRRIQDRLFAAWSGAPTTQILRHRDTHLDRHTKRALHTRLSALANVPMPTVQQEQDDPAEADEAYRAAALWLIKRTRDHKRFSLLFKENTNFGFQRNALGLRTTGATIALLSATWMLWTTHVLSEMRPYYHPAAWQNVTVAQGTSLLVALLMFAIWLLAITPAAARRTGFAYAERLMECADALTTEDLVQTDASAAGSA